LTQWRPVCGESACYAIFIQKNLGAAGNKAITCALPSTRDQSKMRSLMPRPQIHDTARVAAFVLGASRTRYLVMRQEDVWFITFNGEEFGPYRSEREAMLFATDAAHKLGELGEETQVFRVDENGAAAPVWTYGLDPYPPAS
jgi:hypothetical protein